MHVLYNARIYTFSSTRPFATALVIHGERILEWGYDEAILAAYRGLARLQNLGGRIVLPGLIDAHIHLEQYALGMRKVDCEVPSLEECLRRVARRAGGTPHGDWILGHGWNQNDWEGGFPHAAHLDAAAPRHPVYLTAKSLHAGWANQQALQLAGIDAETPDPADGKIQRDPDGRPTGILFEGAMSLVSRAIPEPGVEEVAAAIQQAQKVLWQMGITGVHDFDRQRCFAALQMLHSQERLRLRVTKSIPIESLPAALAVGLRTGFGDDWLRIGSVKAFADGALGPRTAAMLQPFEGEAENRGMLLLDREQLFEHARQASQGGLSMAVHAIGDRANHEVLGAYRMLRAFEREQRLPALRHRIEHVQLIHPQDAPHLAALGVIASMQPIHAISDMQAADRYWGARAETSYAWRTQLNHGAALAFGSDAPVDSPNPFWGLHAAVTRRRPDGSPGPQGWYPGERLKIVEALQAYTTGPAYAAGMESSQGRLAPGFLADLIVMEEDPLTCPADRLCALQPVATMAGGEWVHLNMEIG
jgi:hypothetical protein